MRRVPEEEQDRPVRDADEPDAEQHGLEPDTFDQTSAQSRTCGIPTVGNLQYSRDYFKGISAPKTKSYSIIESPENGLSQLKWPTLFIH